MNRRLERMIGAGAIPDSPGVWIDAYNRSTNEDVAGTVTTRIDSSNHYWVTDMKTEEPKIIQIGSYSPSSACNAKVLDPDGLCPTLLDHKGAEPAVLTPIRTEEQRQLRKQGIDPFGGRQMLPRTDGVSNTITTVQKDNLLQEPCILGYTRDDNGNVGSYHEKDIANTLHGSTGSGGNTDQFVREQVIGSMQANAMRESIDGVSPCLTEAMGKGSGHIPMIVQNPHGFNKGGVSDEVAPAVTSSAYQDNNHLVEPYGCYDNQFGEFFRQPLEGMSRTLKADDHNAVLFRYRIRITDVRVERLNDISDDDILCEGVRFIEGFNHFNFNRGDRDQVFYFDTAKKAYAALIDKISGKGTWQSNPYVFAYTFELVK